MKPFNTELQATKWAEQNAIGPVSVKTCPNYGAAVFTVRVHTLVPFGTLGFIDTLNPNYPKGSDWNPGNDIESMEERGTL